MNSTHQNFAPENKTLQINRYSKSKPKDDDRSQTIEKGPNNVLLRATLISYLQNTFRKQRTSIILQLISFALSQK